MKFNEFISTVKRLGGVDTDGAYGKQCMDLYNYYCNNVLGLNNVGADCAKNILRNPNIMNNVERIDNYPAFIPQKGDIAVWTGSQFGHVAICLGEGDLNVFKTIDQNWKPQTLTEEIHNYTYMAPLVFLRPKNQENIIENVQQSINNNVKYKIGDKVRVSSYYASSTDPDSKAVLRTAIGTITRIINGAKNPYLLDNGSIGWCNDGDIRKLITTLADRYQVGQIVVYSSCYRGPNDTPPNYIDCIREYGSWQQRKIVNIIPSAINKYELDNGMYLNDGDIREVK